MNEYSILNKNYEKIISIIGDELTSSSQIKKNKKKVLSLIKEDFPDITADSLSTSFGLIVNSIPDLEIKLDTPADVYTTICKFSIYIHEVGEQYKDHGYTMLVCMYFWATRGY